MTRPCDHGPCHSSAHVVVLADVETASEHLRASEMIFMNRFSRSRARRAEDAGSARIALLVDQHDRVVVEPDVRPVGRRRSLAVRTTTALTPRLLHRTPGSASFTDRRSRRRHVRSALAAASTRMHRTSLAPCCPRPCRRLLLITVPLLRPLDDLDDAPALRPGERRVSSRGRVAHVRLVVLVVRASLSSRTSSC